MYNVIMLWMVQQVVQQRAAETGTLLVSSAVQRRSMFGEGFAWPHPRVDVQLCVLALSCCVGAALPDPDHVHW